MRTANREKPLPHKPCSFTSSLCRRPAIVQHLYNVILQYMVWYFPTSETAWMQRRQKNWLKYTNFTELKKITSRIYSNCSNYSCLFFKSFQFICYSLCFIKKIVLNGEVCCLFYFLLHSTFFKGRVKSGILVGFIVFFRWAQKTSDFLVGSNYINTEDNGRLIEFLSQISKLCNFSVLDLVDFMMHH